MTDTRARLVGKREKRAALTDVRWPLVQDVGRQRCAPFLCGGRFLRGD